MISIPPQHGKTELANVSVVPWLFTRDSKLRIATSTYNQEHANKVSRATRRVAVDCGIQISSDRKAVEEWELAAGGRYRAVGFGGGLSGYPVDIGIIDDPYKDRAEADSALVRDARWEWYTDVWIARNPAQQLLIGTEWHEAGLHNQIAESPQGKHWTRIKGPAIALDDDPLGRSPGEALCPERVSLEELLERRAMNPYSFEAMYQQNPTPREGALFKVALLRYVDASEVPEGLPMVRKWDTAASAGKGDFTAGVLMAGPCKEGRFYILDVVRGQWEPDEVNRVLLQTAQKDGARVKIIVPQNPGDAGVFQARMFIQHLAGYNVSAERETGSKEVRAEPFAAQVNAGNVVIVRAAWNGALVEEMRSFPNGKHDDQIDAEAGAFNILALGPRVRFSF